MPAHPTFAFRVIVDSGSTVSNMGPATEEMLNKNGADGFKLDKMQVFDREQVGQGVVCVFILKKTIPGSGPTP